MARSTIGPRLRRLRERAGWTQRELERVAHVTHPIVNRIEAGEYEQPSAEIVYRLARALGVPVCQLYPPRPHAEEHVHVA